MKEVMNSYIIKNNYHINDSLEDLKIVVRYLKNLDSNISYRKMERILGVGRKKLKYWGK